MRRKLGKEIGCLEGMEIFFSFALEYVFRDVLSCSVSRFLAELK